MLTAVSGAWADDSGSCGTAVTWSYVESTQTLTISGSGAMTDYNINNQPWKDLKSQITTVTIESGVTSIGDYAFYNCTNLTSISIPASLTSIGDYVFFSSNLTSISLPAGVESIGTGAFNGCINLTAFNVAEENANYASEDGVLFNKTKTTIVSYPAGKTATTYEIPTTVTSIGNGAFAGCSNLTSVNIPANVTSIGEAAFMSCINLTSVTIPSTVTSIGRGAFQYCTNLASVTVYAPSCSLGSNAFDGYTSALKIYVFNERVNYYKNAENWDLYKSLITGLNGGYCGTTGHETDVMWLLTGNTLTIWGTGAMAGYDPGEQPWKAYNGGITSVVIGNGVTNIGRNICYGYTTLTYVSIPASVTSIGEQAFKGCTNLTSITIPDDVTSIGKKAFNICSSLSSINIPAGIETFDRSWFDGCSSLTAINVANENANYSSEDGVLFNKAQTTLIQYPAGKEATTYTIPSTVTSIGNEAFSWSTKLTSVIIPANVTTIGKHAFSMSEKLASVTFAAGSSLTSISDNAFFYCTNLTSITIPAGVTSIGARAFYGCSKLPSITLPASVTSIGDDAFYYCSNVATITLNSSPLIGDYAFDFLKSGAVVAINAPAHDAASYQWATFYNKNYAFQADDNTQVFKVTLAGSIVTLLEVTDKIVDAGTAVVLKSTGTPVMTLTTASSSDTQGNDLVGTSATMTNPGNAYVLNNGDEGVGFYKLAATGTIGFGKAYLVASVAARDFLGFDETTGISEKIKVKSEKSGEGGDVIYDIHGRRVNGKPGKGLYIINGKKVVL